MKRKALLLLLASILATAVTAHADQFLLGFEGFDFQSPNPNPQYLGLGDGYEALGFVTSFGPLLTTHTDLGVNEYTFHLFGLSVATSNFSSGLLEATFVNGGRGQYFEDSRSSGTPGVYGTIPPNGTAPSTFVDGTKILGGRIDNFAVVYDFNVNQGSFYGTLTLDEGLDLGFINPSQYAGWTFAGQAGRPNATVPVGYDNQISGEVRVPDPVPANHQTWGALKSLYRH